MRIVKAGRGIRDASELSLGLADLQRPEGLTGLSAAADLLAAAVTEGQDILIVGDFDAGFFEAADNWAASGRPNLWGLVPDVVRIRLEERFRKVTHPPTC